MAKKKQNVSKEFRKLIRKVEHTRAVRKGKNGLTLSSSASAGLRPSDRTLVEHALQQASDFGGEELLGRGAKSVPYRITNASGSDNALVKQVEKVYKLTARKANALRTVFAETTISYHWWGAELDLTSHAAEAFRELLDPGMVVVLAAMFTSRTAGIILLVLKGMGSGLKSQIAKAASGQGVRIVLFFYLYPLPEARKA